MHIVEVEAEFSLLINYLLFQLKSWSDSGDGEGIGAF